MKKIIIIAITLLTTITMNAQDNAPDNPQYDPFHDRYMIDSALRVLGVSLIFTLIAVLIVTIIRTILNHRVKSKLIDKGVSENLASQFLNTPRKNDKTAAMKWFIILTGVGAGLTFIKLSAPYGLHSLTIMVFCIAASFLGFYFFLKKSGDQ